MRGWLALKGDHNAHVVAGAVVSTPLSGVERVNEPTRWLTCLQCKEKITKTVDRIAVNGKHEHTFINPVGVMFRIGCFGVAAGVMEVGEPSERFTWFAGHVWCVGICRRCERHLGWTFAAGDSQFVALILSELSGPE